MRSYPIYLDYQASTPMDKRVLAKMLPHFETSHVNPHSISLEGRLAMRSIDIAREKIAQLINCGVDEVYFTSGATESNNTIIRGVTQANKTKRDTIIISAIEHSSVREVAHQCEQEYGVRVRLAPVDGDGLLDLKAYQKLLDDSVLLVSVMSVNNEIGVIQDIKKIAQLAHAHGALMHSDAAQLPVVNDINVYDCGLDFMSLSAHKMYGPKGIGALFIAQDVASRLKPLVYGGGQQEGIRAGTLPTALCVGFGEAAHIIAAERGQLQEHCSSIQQVFLKTLKDNGVRFRVNGSLKHRHPGNLNLCFIDVDAQQLLTVLGRNITASLGSACNSGIDEPSHVLSALGLSKKEALSSIRFGFGKQTNKDDAIQAANLIAEAMQMQTVQQETVLF